MMRLAADIPATYAPDGTYLVSIQCHCPYHYSLTTITIPLRLQEPGLYFSGDNSDRDFGVVDDILADAPKDRAPDDPKPTGTHDDHGGLLLVSVVNDDLTWAANLLVDASTDLEREGRGWSLLWGTNRQAIVIVATATS